MVCSYVFVSGANTDAEKDYYSPAGKRLGINLGEGVCKQNFSFCGKLLSTAW